MSSSSIDSRRLPATPLPIFVVNLPQQVERRELMAAQLKAAHLPFEIISAVDGRALSDRELAAHYDDAAAKKACGRGIARSEIGCALSHQSIYRRMLDQRLPWAVIMEDDILLGRDFRPVLNALTDTDLGSSEVCVFSHIDKYTNWGRRRVLGRYWRVKPQRAYGGRCYLITAAAARALLEFNHPIRFPIDYWMHFQKAGLINLRAIVPYCVGFAPCERDSLIEPERREQESLADKTSSGGTLRAWIEKYIYRKCLYQLGIKQMLRVKKQKVLW